MEEPLQRHRALYKSPAAPPWKETYRQRCVERLKNSRARLLDRYRQAGENVPCKASGALLVEEVMEQEWRALRAADRRLPSLGGEKAFSQVLEYPDELAVLEEIQQELILQEQLTIEEYERSLRFDEECLSAMLDGLETSNKIICPVCKRNYLTVVNHLVLCQCGLCLPAQGLTEQMLQSLLEDCVTEHSCCCPHIPTFSIASGMEGETCLLMSCPVCDAWAVVL
uniref:RPA interacting protein n=1 Tax=Sphenodon punctatus TaxID=8508 RepID=A0A8D0L750_SPHPU